MKNRGRNGKRLVLVPGPFQGHLTPMLQWRLSSSPRTSPSQLLTHSSTVLILLLTPISPSCAFLMTYLKKRFKTLICPAFKECLTRGPGMEPADKIFCIIYDARVYVSEGVARDLKIPSIVLREQCCNYRSSPNSSPAQGHVPIPDSMLQVPVPLHQPLRFKDLPLSNLRILDYYLKVVVLTHNIRLPSAIIFNTFHCLEESPLAQLYQQYQVPIFPIGPLHKFAPTSDVSLLQEDTGCITWLDKQTHNSVIFVSLGSIARMNPDQLSEMAWVWQIARPGSIPGSEWMESMDEEFRECVKERGCIVKWVPQKKVLAHDAVGGFWNHCGWNSTLESICEGVLMICQPCFGDPKMNARYLTHEWRVGLEVEGEIERGTVVRTVRTLMKEKGGEEMRQRVLDLKHRADVISISDGGSSCHYLSELVELFRSC
ncbi:LOW QUALITY PROTEIN: hypothetical protein BT93_J1437 [Corymbia citriodora subsp. variegata]|nr:LOW QUALITY PROTEIN: hypothetical protein BT93_J1437 [Corymbia citriodora subsp. variegata]